MGGFYWSQWVLLLIHIIPQSFKTIHFQKALWNHALLKILFFMTRDLSQS